jgi:hypothetical protein
MFSYAIMFAETVGVRVACRHIRPHRRQCLTDSSDVSMAMSEFVDSCSGVTKRQVIIK